MLLSNRFQPRTILRFAMVALIGAFSTAFLTRSPATSHADLIDGVRGAFLGATLALLAIWMIVQRRSQSR